MSLWQIQDHTTAAWMSAFYDALLVGDRAVALAVCDASRALVDERRRQGRNTHPFWWGAFVALGP